jgi:YcaO-like protein with predicted kinase domain
LKRRHAAPDALALLEPELLRFGITRVAQQTRLDTTGVPCYAAIRPNSRTLAVHQGKGLDDAAARLSAIMEAIEFAVGESPRAERTISSIETLAAAGQNHYLPARSLPKDYSVKFGVPLTWVAGQCLATGATALVPLDCVSLAPNTVERLPFSQSSNGLAAGFTRSEATAHALCELIERDASSLWSMRSLGRAAATALAIDQIDDPTAVVLIQTIATAGFCLRLFDLTSDLGVPVIMALLWTGQPTCYFDVAAGVCAHPSATRALTGAISEAAQTRTSNIAGARDDIEPSDYAKPLPEWIGHLIGMKTRSQRPLPQSMQEAQFVALPGRLPGRTLATPLSAPGDRVWVVKLLSEGLEDRATNAHWRPGTRAIRALTAL